MISSFLRNNKCVVVVFCVLTITFGLYSVNQILTESICGYKASTRQIRPLNHGDHRPTQLQSKPKVQIGHILHRFSHQKDEKEHEDKITLNELKKLKSLDFDEDFANVKEKEGKNAKNAVLDNSLMTG